MIGHPCGKSKPLYVVLVCRLSSKCAAMVGQARWGEGRSSSGSILEVILVLEALKVLEVIVFAVMNGKMWRRNKNSTEQYL